MSCKSIERLENLKNYLDIRYRKDIAVCIFYNAILQLCIVMKILRKNSILLGRNVFSI